MGSPSKLGSNGFVCGRSLHEYILNDAIMMIIVITFNGACFIMDILFILFFIFIKHFSNPNFVSG